MNNTVHENKTWLQKLAAEVESTTIDPEREKLLLETALSVAYGGSIPAIYGQPAREASVEERLESLRYVVSLTEEVPDPI